MIGPLSTVADLVERVRLVPDALREFTAGRDEAHALYGLDPATLTHLRDTGFPVSGCSGNARYDPYDLANAALHLGRRSIQQRAMVSWRHTLEEAVGRPVARYQITWPTGTSRRLALESAQTFAGRTSARRASYGRTSAARTSAGRVQGCATSASGRCGGWHRNDLSAVGGGLLADCVREPPGVVLLDCQRL